MARELGNAVVVDDSEEKGLVVFFFQRYFRWGDGKVDIEYRWTGNLLETFRTPVVKS